MTLKKFNVTIEITPTIDVPALKEAVHDMVRREIDQRGIRVTQYDTLEEALRMRHKGVGHGVTEAAADEQRRNTLPAADHLSRPGADPALGTGLRRFLSGGGCSGGAQAS